MFQKDVLAGKKGVVTGGSSGIGLAIAKYLTAHGAQLTIVGRDEAKLAAAAEEIGEGTTTAQGDVRDPESVERNMREHMDAHGQVDFLVNNAAGNFLCPLEKMSNNAFKSVMEIVANGTFYWSKAAQPHMKAAGRGSIVNIGTTYSWGHGAYVGHSGAAKAGVLNLTRTMAVEWGPMGIRSNLIAPGPVKDTEGVRRLVANDKMKGMMMRMMPTPRLAEGEEIASMALYLISPLGDYVNGAAIPVDGGLSLVVPGLLPAGIPLEL